MVSIEEGAFENCVSLTKIDIPDGIKEIKDSTFSNCINLTEITIPYTVYVIGVHAFDNCNKLKTVKGKKGSYAELWAKSNDYVFLEADIYSQPKKTKPTSIIKVKSLKKALKVIWKKVNGINGYQIQYSLKKNFKKSKKITINKPKTTFKSIKKLKSKKKYYVRIRTFVVSNKTRLYSKWSKTKTKKTK